MKIETTIRSGIQGVICIAISLFIFGCAAPGPSVQGVQGPTVGGGVSYGDAKAVETLTNQFGATDLQTIAESMARSLLQTKLINSRKDAPVMTLAEVKNKTGEYIDTRAITEKI